MAATTTEALKEDLLFEIDCNIRYHDRLRTRYKSFMSFSDWLFVVLGSGVVVDVLGGTGIPGSGKELPAILAFVMVLLQAFGMVYRIGESRSRHDELYRRFVALKREVVSVGNPKPSHIARWKSSRELIEAEELELKGLSMLKANNDTLRMRGHGPNHGEWNMLTTPQRLFTPLLEYQADRVKQRKELPTPGFRSTRSSRTKKDAGASQSP